MYAIVEIAGQQFKVAKDQKILVHRLQDKEGSKVSFDKVLLLDDGKKITVEVDNLNQLKKIIGLKFNRVLFLSLIHI